MVAIVLVASFMFLADTSLGKLTLPTINSTSPYDGETNTTLNGSIFIYFSEDMQKSSVENAFTLSPHFDGTFYWPDNQTLEYRPDDWIPNETWFNVTIKGSAKDLQGLSLDGNDNSYPEGSPVDDYNFTFKSDFPPQVSFTTPLHRSTILPRNRPNIQVWFSRAMNTTSVESGYTISPPVSVASHAWLGGNTRFIINLNTLSPLNNYFNWSTLYTVTVSGNVKSSGVPVQTLDGDFDSIPEGSPTDDYTFSFTTVTPVNVSSYSVPDNLGDSIEVNFSSDMANSLTEPEVSVGVGRDVTFDSSPYSDKMYVSANLSGHSVGYWRGNTTYNLTITGDAIGKNLEDLDGDGDGLVEGSPIDDFTFNFTTIPTPKVVSVFPLNGSTGIKINQDIYFNFSVPMNRTATEDSFNISPSVGGSFVWVDNRTLVFNPWQYVHNVSYSVSIGGKDINNTPLDGDMDEYIDLESYNFTFRTLLDQILPTISGYGVLDDGETSDIDHTTIRMDYYDNVGIDNGSIKVYINGVDYTNNASISNSSVYLYLSNLDNGDYDISVLVVDLSGNEVWKNWTFTIKVLTPRQIGMDFAVAGMAIAIVGVGGASVVLIGRKMGWIGGKLG